MTAFRPLQETDKPMIAEWIARDEYHRDWMVPDFFFVPDMISFVVEDEEGPIMFFRLDPLNGGVIMYTQFKADERLRTAKALLQAYPTIRDLARNSGAAMIVFDSKSPSLVRFGQKYFGFKPLANHPDRYIDLL